MRGQCQAEAGPAHAVELPEILDLRAVSQLTATLLGLRGLPVEIHASCVRHVGGQGLQVLLSAAITWKTDGIPFTIASASPDFGENLARLGLPITAFDAPERPK
jgi:chemotaxis protein CheX